MVTVRCTADEGVASAVSRIAALTATSPDRSPLRDIGQPPEASGVHCGEANADPALTGPPGERKHITATAMGGTICAKEYGRKSLICQWFPAFWAAAGPAPRGRCRAQIG